MTTIAKRMQILMGITLACSALDAHAWGRRGHQIVGETGATLVSTMPDADFMRGHSFDFGYYANVPDFGWKRPATYAFEKPQHFMDMEIFDRAFAQHPEIQNPLALSRKEFEAKFPDVKPEAGRAFWRVREMYGQLENLTEQLRQQKEKTGDAHQTLQLRWLVLAGTLSHYIGDLSMPLHVSENYDGNLSGQKGIHAYYEEFVVDELYPDLETNVFHEAARAWPKFHAQNQNKSVLDLLLQLTEKSRAEVPKMLALDKKSDRKNLKKNAKMYEPMIREGLVRSSLTLAEMYSRVLGWSFDDERFYRFEGEPAYIYPEGAPMPEKDLAKHR